MHPLPRIMALTAALLVAATAPAAGSPRPTTSVTLAWTAPGDDGHAGQAQKYVLRYSTDPITDENFDRATPVHRIRRPAPAGSRETFTVRGLDPETRYYFAIKTLDRAGNASPLSNVAAVFSSTVGVDGIPAALSFSAPVPNPARASLSCAYALPEPGAVEVEVFGVDGRRVAGLASGWRPAGFGEVTWDLRDDAGRRVAAGVYLVRARLGGAVWSERAAVIR